jgi:hypothetical protein
MGMYRSDRLSIIWGVIWPVGLDVRMIICTPAA